MRRLTWIIATLAALAGLTALTGCGDGSDDNTIPVATVGPLTGQYASNGQQMKQGATLVVEDLNAAGGVLGKQLKLEIGDDACDPKQAVAVAGQMVGEGVPLVAGHFCSGSSIPASQIYGDADTVMISPASTNPALTDDRAGPNIYRVCGRDDQQGKVAGEYIAKHFAGKNIAFVHDKTAYGKGLADETKKAMNAAGLQEKLYEAISAGEKDYSALVSKLKRNDIDLIFLGGYHTEAGLIARQMRGQGMDTVLMGGDALVNQEYWSITGKAGEGTLMTFSPDPRKNPAAKDVVARFEAKGIEPEGYVLYTYAAMQAWAQAAEKAGSTASSDVIKALNDTEFDTVIGKFRFNEKGDPSLPPYAVYRWHDGDYAEIEK
ncbi:branched-chain amino acid ABC transporter substrate-binding protein [Methyloligella sp. 2.7D]|uniref:branched-chain amino acid ABC transporter substrate-binding protein n=1 Tax=unclassified Methyloligella TaxID=2625955 RepID=UPI00157E03D1|nr:branched-chain amino acid ABC transporter substrate-binding protein [Methyloligella sp. GL2]QKP77840.1 branched-chain amino acid ABC transporter substrate-binding protein [Methyloligella sp. GL2]